MTNAFAVLISTILMTNSHAGVDYDSRVVCRNGICEKKEVFTNIKSNDLKAEDLKVDSCLLDIPRNRFYRIEDLDLRLKKLTLLSESKEEKISVELRRDVVYTDSKNFDLKMKVINCENVNGYVINNEQRYIKCLQNNSKRTLRLWCEKERVRNF